MRLDKFLSNLWFWSRSILAKFIKNNWVIVNSEEIFDKEFELKLGDRVDLWGKEIVVRWDIYMILHKPEWYVSSSKREAWYPSFLDLMEDEIYARELNIVWRLDVDTTWLLLLSNNWDFIHRVISPKKDIFKKYLVKTRDIVDSKQITKLESWVKIDDDYITKPAFVELINDYEIYLSISEWKFHQIKKMLLSVWNEVVKLHREAIWWLSLWDLKVGEYREIYESDIEKIFNQID